MGGNTGPMAKTVLNGDMLGRVFVLEHKLIGDQLTHGTFPRDIGMLLVIYE